MAGSSYTCDFSAINYYNIRLNIVNHDIFVTGNFEFRGILISQFSALLDGENRGGNVIGMISLWGSRNSPLKVRKISYSQNTVIYSNTCRQRWDLQFEPLISE